MKTYCENCSDKECTYIEVQKFIEYVNDVFEMNYRLEICPDKYKKEYTCDLQYLDNNNSSTIYIEIKECKYSFNDTDNNAQAIARENGQNEYSKILRTEISHLNKQKYQQLNDYTINIPKAQIDKNDIKEFPRLVAEFLKKTAFTDREYQYVYKRKNRNQEVKFLFQKKEREDEKQFGDKILTAYLPEKPIPIIDLINKTQNIEALIELIDKNSKNTSEKKFPNNQNRKILLNILTLPLGNDIFFNLNFNSIITNLLNSHKHFDTAADENYLLYYTNDYFETDENGNCKMLGEVLFIIPLQNCTINRVIAYFLKE